MFENSNNGQQESFPWDAPAPKVPAPNETFAPRAPMTPPMAPPMSSNGFGNPMPALDPITAASQKPREEKDDYYYKEVGTAEVSIEDLLSYAVEHNCSDLHITVGVPPIVRENGTLISIPGMPVITAKMAQELVRGIMNSEQLNKFDQQWELDFSYPFHDRARFRVNAFHQKGNCSMALRKIPTNPIPLEDLKLPPIIGKLAGLKQGLILVTGPTGSGKSTTLAAIIDKINKNRNEHIITIEDPIEFQHEHKKSVVQQREIGEDTHDFPKALKSILREDPDVVLIGEMRDLETIAAAVTTAETGHLVFGTLHTNSASSSIDRMIDVFPPHQQQQIRMQISSSLQAIISQRLIPNLHGGRTCVMEILICTSAIRNLIREGKTHQMESMMTAGKDTGMQLFDLTLASEVRKGAISYEVALKHCNDPKQFAEVCGKR